MAEEQQKQDQVLEGGTYEIIRGRLNTHGEELLARVNKLNEERKSVFGSIEFKLIDSDRITTENNCVARDMIPVGRRFLFGYNVRFGLKSTVEISDVFAVYTFDENNKFHPDTLKLISNGSFEEDFANLYKYYKETQFAKFFSTGPHLYMVFRVGKRVSDVKTFKWAIEGDELHYLDNRSDHEYRYPEQHEFRWKRTHRDMHRAGAHPHISIDDRLFVETVGGDLTIKVEDNTDTGAGIYEEAVENPDQILDDAEVYYAIIGPIILLKIRPYQEDEFRYIVYNEKTKTARRIDDIEDSCVLLPDSHGLIFSSGYYLVSGEYKQFEHGLCEMLFERRMQSSNGEDYLYVFYNRENGTYIILSYNLIEKRVETPIICGGYSFFDDGELVYFTADPEPQKHHTVQVWQTPYVGPNHVPAASTESYLYKIGNKDIVKAMAECHEVLRLIHRPDPYEGLYIDIVRQTQDVMDSYFWVGEERTGNLKKTLGEIRETAGAAIEEFEKVSRIRKQTLERVREVSLQTDSLVGQNARRTFESVDHYVESLAELRKLRGEIISLRDLRYANGEEIDALEKRVSEQSSELSKGCVEFLLRPDALDVYQSKVHQLDSRIAELDKVTEAKDLEESVAKVSSELELLIEIVSNLKIDDSTKTTQIIDNISSIFTVVNQVRSKLARRKKDLQGTEAVAEFGSQMKLLNQGVINYLDICDTPEKCDEYLNKLLVQIEELEGRFTDFDAFIIQLAEKREEAANAFESKKLALIEARNKRAVALHSAADRILKGIDNRARNLKAVSDINGYFASDLMIEKVRGIVEQLIEMGDSVKADEIGSKLKSIKEDAVRQLRDRQDLFVDGENIIKFGKHRFNVNTQPLDLTSVMRNGELTFHITGTNFFEKATDEKLLSTKSVWNQEYVSENADVYRAEYLAYLFMTEVEAGRIRSISELSTATVEEVSAEVQKFMGPRFSEGYVKGVHDHDAARIVSALIDLNQTVDLLRYRSIARACARCWWETFADSATKKRLSARLRGLGAALRVVPHRTDFADHIEDLGDSLRAFIIETELFDEDLIPEAAEYLFHELTGSVRIVTSPESAQLLQGIRKYLDESKSYLELRGILDEMADDDVGRFDLIRTWVNGYIENSEESELRQYADEVAAMFFADSFDPSHVLNVTVVRDIEAMTGSHDLIVDGVYRLNYPEYMERLYRFTNESVPLFESYVLAKKDAAEEYRDNLRLDEFKPRILTSFVRNKLIDEVYLPMLGDNLAKQMGAAGADKRTDRMGMLLLVSPPGYGKTTLMEYVANRLGIVFMKINGPAIGHRVTSLDPSEAPNATAKEELEKLNLSLEMGDNVMIYLDDIQHCNPEFLQKFISLCDAQRKIEGVWRGRTRTYDLRGKKVCVVMAGNPYTESGEKFQIPDMLANRADTYNLGDIIGDQSEAFEMSYIENSLTSNAVLARVASRASKDIYSILRLANSGDREGIELEGNYSTEELNEIVSVLKKMLVVRDVILRVNAEYIASAAQADDYRTEPPFKLQGSYRNMNKLAEKVLPIMNDEELRSMILAHYEGESQTLTTGAEANMLKFREMFDFATEEELARWKDIKDTFCRNQKFRGMDSSDSMTQAVTMLGDLGDGITRLREDIGSGLRGLVGGSSDDSSRDVKAVFEPETLVHLRESFSELARAITESRQDASTAIRAEFAPETIDQLKIVLAEIRDKLAAPSHAVSEGTMARPVSAHFTLEAIEALKEIFGDLKVAGGEHRVATGPPSQSETQPEVEVDWSPKEGEFHAAGSMRRFLESMGYAVEEVERTLFRINRENKTPTYFRILEDRFYVQARVGNVNHELNGKFYEELLDLNTKILPVSIGIDRSQSGENVLMVIESREGSSLTKNELGTILRSLDHGCAEAKSLLEQYQSGS